MKSMDELAKRLRELPEEIIQRSTRLWPKQGDRWKALGLNTKQYLQKLEANNGQRLSRAKITTIIAILEAIEEEERRRIEQNKC